MNSTIILLQKSKYTQRITQQINASVAAQFTRLQYAYTVGPAGEHCLRPLKWYTAPIGAYCHRVHVYTGLHFGAPS